MFGFSRDAQLQATGNTSCWHKEICTLNDVMEIANSLPRQNSSQTSVFWRGAANAIARRLNFCYISIEK
jgi:hypothetical protein